MKFNASSPDELALVNAARAFGYFFCERDTENNMVIKYNDGMVEKYKLLNVIEFDSARKRMTVIVKTPNDEIKIMCKGADSIIYPRLVNRDLIESTDNFLESYAGEGLRTLLLAEKTISLEEYEEWLEKYNEASMATVNREEKVAEVEDSIEYDFELVGATAIEDRLQDDVSNTISVLKEAGIKIWVLTGDKIETAINIGYSCKVLNNEMDQYIIDKLSTDDIIDQIADANKQYMKSSVTSYALIVAGDSLLKITNRDSVKEEFMRLAEKMNVVIACRVSPKQKAEIVNLVKDRYPDKTTLAIGDGANDVNMITAAHIGIGISGLEGQQAARASDYAIGQFRFLRTLLLIHGREAYRRNSYVVGYMFYKNIIFVMTIFWYGIYCNYSGQTIFDEWLYQIYNITYTALAIMWFAIFDFEYPKEVLYKNPKYYIIGLENMCFSNYKFGRWIFYGIWQSLVLTLLSFYPFENQGGSMWLEGNFVYLGIVIIVNIKVLTSTNNHTFISLFFQVGSIVFFMISSWIMSYVKFSVLYGTIVPTMGSLEYYYILIFMLLAIVQVDVGVNYVNKKVRQYTINYARKIKARLQKMRSRKSVQVKPMPIKQKTYRTGFAFSQEPGSAPQVVDTVRQGSFSDNRITMLPHKDLGLLTTSNNPRNSNSKTIYQKSGVASRSAPDVFDPIQEESQRSSNV